MQSTSVNHVSSTVDVIHHSTQTQDLGVLYASSTGGTPVSSTVCAFRLTNGSPTMSRTTRKIPFHMLSNIINLIHVVMFPPPHFICFCIDKCKTKQETIMFCIEVATFLNPFLQKLFVSHFINVCHVYMVA